MIVERPITWDAERSRCAAIGSKGRCQLRGSIGHASATGGYWYCAWHDEVVVFAEPCCLENFTKFIKEQKASGSTRWDHLTIDAWWSLVQGEVGLGCWDWKAKEAKPTLTTDEEMPGYE